MNSAIPKPSNSECRQLQLQANINGSWKTVVLFYSGCAQTVEKVQQGACLMHEASPKSSWRITTCDGRSPEVMSHMGPQTYGLWIDALRS